MKKHNLFIKRLLLKRFVFLAAGPPFERAGPPEDKSEPTKREKEIARNTIRAKILELADNTNNAKEERELRALEHESSVIEQTDVDKAEYADAKKLLKLLLERGVKFRTPEETAIAPLTDAIEIEATREAAEKAERAAAEIAAKAARKAAAERAEAEKEGEKAGTIKMAEKIQIEMGKLCNYLVDEKKLAFGMATLAKSKIAEIKRRFKTTREEIVKKAEAGDSRDDCKNYALGKLDYLINALENEGGETLYSDYSKVKLRLIRERKSLKNT